MGSARIPYRVFGSGRPLVLVHGGSPGSKAWEVAASALAESRMVVLPDLSGSDAARDDGGELTVEVLAEQVAAVISDLGQGPADAAGHSMGGAVVAALAVARPELVRSLVLVTGWTGRGDRYLREATVLWRQLAGDTEAFARYSMLIAFSREYLESVPAGTVAEMAAAYRPVPGRLRQIDLALRLDVRDLLPEVSVPTLVIGCSRDTLISARYSRELAAAITGAEYAEIESGHQVMVERPEEFVELVRGFAG
ncbi:alpha/beta fold hydrolase [Nocardia aurantia]|uniref:alpha/beta fold hydrolase n=1 Tax=Nocardia aurantia TaxID=2585199 RepID=UPI0012950216|nr:alpha/beta hydrolase [Nocardia aurantia]